MSSFGALAGIFGGIISFAAFIPYFIGTWRRKTRPHRATWCIWTLVGILLAASYYSVGARHTLWVAISYVAGPLVIAVISFKFGEGGWSRLDRFCLAGAALSLIPWWFSRSPVLTLVCNLLIDLMGATPTIRKAFQKPRSEDGTAWILFLIGNTLNLGAIEKIRFSFVIYPAYMFALSGLITAMIFIRRIQRPNGQVG